MKKLLNFAFVFGGCCFVVILFCGNKKEANIKGNSCFNSFIITVLLLPIMVGTPLKTNMKVDKVLHD